ncbi:hypothetical protein [Levilactobacillus brevis]|uniref:Uncharacterized protein n=2 Tax=Levilactobacillus brevis TaxID=1580 RepID=A0AA41ERW0_LEVBR|nr:hypothetical protein [Levilactobacillus brevis]KID43809.1 hypothetical protein LbDm2_1265 [Levilactobacillus brevis]MBS0948549.1 hypothetical protein [Levilactobacillus brevis]MBS0978734.1 hypothetical protein [Levilactobacillus brevis]MBS1011747.1 hypothetical protein [Levilactobacillus brevis]MCU0200109.1 hypothetical protein [Levilactobacillus brevis]
MTTLMAFLKNRTVQQLVIFTACQNSLWWLAGSTVNTGSPLTTLVKFYLLMYGGLLAAGVFLILKHHFQSRIGPVLVVAAATMGFLAAPNAHLVQFFALLICLFLVLVCLPQLGLQSVYGLVVFSCLAGCGIPVVLFFLRNHYLALQFLTLLLPLVASYLVFFEPYYLPAERDWRLTLISPLILIIIMSGVAFSWRILVVILIVTVHWWLQPRLNERYRLVTSGLLQLITGLFILL